ncbi:hypothetical protein Hanom_Chr12g01146481 [Helianthus anomalus]
MGIWRLFLATHLIKTRFILLLFIHSISFFSNRTLIYRHHSHHQHGILHCSSIQNSPSMGDKGILFLFRCNLIWEDFFVSSII